VNDITGPRGGCEGRVQRASASGSLPLARALPPGAFPSRRPRPDYERMSQNAILVELGDREQKALALTVGSF
jgi:hypothetical protein